MCKSLRIRSHNAVNMNHFYIAYCSLLITSSVIYRSQSVPLASTDGLAGQALYSVTVQENKMPTASLDMQSARCSFSSLPLSMSLLPS